MTVAAANDLARNVINLSGTAEARNVSGKSGAIVLSGDGGAVVVTGKIDTSTAPHTTQVIVPIPAARPSYRGGDITITGGAIKLADADDRCQRRRGRRRHQDRRRLARQWPGADGNNARCRFPDLDHGGRPDRWGRRHIVLWSDDTTTFEGSISARGAGEDGDGGFVEVSGKDRLAYRGFTDTRAPGGNWGTLLLDPTSYVIAASPPAPGAYNFMSTTAVEFDPDDDEPHYRCKCH